MDSDSETKLLSLITQLISLNEIRFENWYSISFEELLLSIIQIISLVRSMVLDSQPESELISLTKQAISVFNSMNANSQPEPLRRLIFLISQKISRGDEPHSTRIMNLKRKAHYNRMFREFGSLLCKTLRIEPEPELISLIHLIVSFVISINPEWKKLISLCPQVRVSFEGGKFHVVEEANWINNSKWDCHPLNWMKFSMTGPRHTHFLCRGCSGHNHEEYVKAPLEIKHPLFHPEHSLQLVSLKEDYSKRQCYCCDENLKEVFYYCLACDFAIDLACSQKSPALSVNLPTWHSHTLALFPRQASLTCSLCGLDDPTSPVYMCPPCDFVVHLRCIELPRVIRISRHLHRISFIRYFDQGNWSCHVCRKRINNDYGGYSCIKKSCSYVAHSRCATQKNVWDGAELEGEPEKDVKEIKPFVRTTDGIIHHLHHRQHHLKLDENTCREYDDQKLCQACNTPIYFGNFYFCMQCDSILHEECANLPREIDSPIHPHMLTLVKDVIYVNEPSEDRCAACYLDCRSGFFYVCQSKRCYPFRLHVQCAKISEPFVHESHMHPLFLTTKPEEERICWVCKTPRQGNQLNATFNCIESDFVLCFRCATLPQKVRYKHDKHILTLSYGKETSTMTSWCEICEEIIKPEKRFYTCEEYCCVTIHVKCLIGKELYRKPGSSFFYYDEKVHVLPSYYHMSRPICSSCKKRCPYKIVYRWSGLIFCSTFCTFGSIRADQLV